MQLGQATWDDPCYSKESRCEAANYPTVSHALAQDPGRLPGWNRLVVVQLARLHGAGLVHGGLSEEPRVIDGRAVLPAPAAQPLQDERQDWRDLGGWLVRWLAVAPARGLEIIADELRSDMAIGDVPCRLLELEERFADVWRFDERATLGAGAMGEVLRVRDRVLGRDVAMKVLHSGAVGRSFRQRFISEAQLTAQLQHPSIVPVIDFGTLPNGNPYYTMKVVDGRSLREVLRAVHAACGERWVATDDGWSLRRLIEALVRVCDAMAYAHNKGVVHRDLKPDNVMVGAFGEVQIVDWGLARGVTGQMEDRLDLAPVQTVRTDGEGTQLGDVFGTPCYMAPEQARGEVHSIDSRTDVYAIGAMLYELLVGVAPWFELPKDELISRLRAGPDAPRAAHALPLPEPLVDLAQASMCAEPDGRPRDASAVAQQLRGWLDGQERTGRATVAVDAVLQLERSSRELARRADELRQEAETALGDLPSWAPVQDKLSAWRSMERAADLARQAAVTEVRYEQGLRAALDHDPQHRGALDAVATLYRSNLRRAERRQDVREVARLTTLLTDHDGGRHAAWLRGDGRITLVTDPVGAKVVARRLQLVDRRLVPTDERELGRTPLLDVQLPRGSYLLTIDAPGHHAVTYPVFIERGGCWSGVAPEAREPEPIWLPPLGTLAADDRYVPAGWFLAGGDADAVDPMSPRRMWCDGFVIKQHPVTHGEYLEFLNDLVRRGEGPLAERCAPARDAVAGASRSLYERDDQGYRLPVNGVAHRLRMSYDRPVCSVDWFAASTYAQWRGAKDGRQWRLLHSMEWEKAAAGVDGRQFPWGNHYEPTWACTLVSHEGQPTPARVLTYANDRGPYDVYGMAGNARTWCLDSYQRGGPVGSLVRIEPDEGKFRMCRGGAYSTSAPMSRSRTRVVLPPRGRTYTTGVRLGVSVASIRSTAAG